MWHQRLVIVVGLITIRDRFLETPNFLDLLTRLSSDTTTYPLHTKATPHEASSYIITSTREVQLLKGVVDVSLFMIW
jgi:hypothetical protein